MKIMTLNTWGGRAGISQLKSFFEKHQDTDVFCLQEIWQTQDLSLIEAWDPRIVTDLLEQISACLPEHHFFFRPQYRGIYGLALFVRKGIAIETEGEEFVFKQQGHENPAAIGNHGRNIQFVTVKTKNDFLTIINFHGLWNGLGKNDSEDRLLQSEKIAAFIQTLNHPYILAGDFNLNPDTESFKILAEACAKDLVKDHGVVSTRSRHYEKTGKFADYVLTSKEIQVQAFYVLPDEVSDHLALSLTIRGLGSSYEI